MRDFDVLYLCDGRACERCHPDDCKHTSDIEHAINFGKCKISEEKNVYFERGEDVNHEEGDMKNV